MTKNRHQVILGRLHLVACLPVHTPSFPKEKLMSKGWRIFLLSEMLWSVGAAGLFVVGLFEVARVWTTDIRTVHFVILLAISLLGLTGVLYFKNPAEQLAWSAQERKAIRRITRGWVFISIGLLVVALDLLVAKLVTIVFFRSAGIATVSFSVFGWMILGCILLLFPLYLLVDRLENHG